MPRAAKPFRERKWNPQLPCRSYHKLYCGATWLELRESWLRSYPLCIDCLKEGISKLANVVDHVEPHKGDTETFFDLRNLQSLCTIHHNKKTYRENGNGKS
jgi:5-methylcytosine-specific restriction protein A